MYVIREVVHCKPGKVRAMMEKFRALSAGLESMRQRPLRLLTDVSGEPFWTLVAEVEVERIEDFFLYEARLMEDDGIRGTMADYHALVDGGRREVYRVEEAWIPASQSPSTRATTSSWGRSGS